MPAAALTYAHQVSPWDVPMSLGVHAFIEYNGYILNDRHQSDRIRVTSITGLDDTDISDSREVVPGDEGEFVYDSWRRGRTIVLTGEIQAGSMGVLKALERDLKAAFGMLVESPMKFRWFDVFDSFDDTDTLDNYTGVIGYENFDSLAVAGSVLQWATTEEMVVMRAADNRLWGDAQTTLRVVMGVPGESSSIFIVPKLKTSNDLLKVGLNVATQSLFISVVVGSSETVIATQAVTGLSQGQSVWLRAKTEGDLVTAELWFAPPAESAFPDFLTSVGLAGTDADVFGDQILSQIGIGAQTATTNWVFDDFRVESICPCDIAYNVRKLSPLSIKDSQDSRMRFVRSFQVTMRASKPYVQCATQSRSQVLVPSLGGTTELGFTSPIHSPLVATTFIDGSISFENQLLFINNRGNAPCRPVFQVFGPIINFSINNLTNGQQFTWTSELEVGDYLTFDCANRTLVNSSSENMLAFMNISIPQWMWLEPGWNDIYISGSGYTALTSLVAFYRGTWA